ncbi:stress-induced-phosphoprotein 1-like [Centruroides vittatus]|uniref:stress-induced-phosphoprotein 1-like n=1 Tax=Centruroides vittatus TaxID=120091 RepID=UPI0035109740
MPPSQVLELKEKGNESLKKGNYAEAMIHYTHALKLDPSNYQLYSNRSLAFLKLQQYYYALEDAKQTISYKPDWAKGYFRKGEVEFQTEHYSDAIESYRKALQLEDDPNLVDAIRKAKRELYLLRKADVQYPWIGAGVGFILGALLVAADTVIKEESFLQHPFLKVLLIVVTVCICYAVTKWHRHYLSQYRKSLLELPFDLFGNQGNQ